jgi:hypothetical protein
MQCKRTFGTSLQAFLQSLSNQALSSANENREISLYRPRDYDVLGDMGPDRGSNAGDQSAENGEEDAR